MDYTLFYKESFDNGEIGIAEKYDYFFSGFDDCERTKTIFDQVNATSKIWIDFPHYNINKDGDNVYRCTSYKEDEAFIALFERLQLSADLSICIDITGFIRPHLIFFIVYLARIGIKKISFLYSEPRLYKYAEDTTFSGFVDDIKIIEGCSSSINNPNTDNDLLIITAGYDDKLIASISQFKSKIKHKFYIIGFPSLQPDMYQEGILKMHSAKDSIGKMTTKYAPAFDPFVTAQSIDEIIQSCTDYSNVYLSPLSTKPQTLGIAIYYLWNYQRMSINIIFPYSKNYFSKTAIGVKKTWKYVVELP